MKTETFADHRPLPTGSNAATQSQTEARGIRYDISVAVVSFNTREILRRCLQTLEAEAGEIRTEILVVDNGSRDGSAEMVSREFPGVRLVAAGRNLGFAAANNLAIQQSSGRYVVLLNSDAFLCPGALAKAVEHMDREPRTGLGGGRLTGEDGSWQPSARQFPSVLNDFLSMTGLAHRFPKSKFWGRADRTWADPLEEACVDWVPGAFSIIRASVLDEIGLFDENFFLYYEEVDLCRRIKGAGYAVRYWPDVVIVHLGGESAKSVPQIARSKSGAQLTLWRLRSGYLYYRKHHGAAAWRSMAVESWWHALRYARNKWEGRAERALESRAVLTLVRRAWKDTEGGQLSPAKPW
jgi:GT2 family glycosyltransferase